MGLFSKLRRRIKKAVSRVKTRVSTARRKLRKAVSKIRAAPRIITKDIRRSSRKLRARAGGVYEAADVAARGYLPGHITPTASKTRRLRKSATERAALSVSEAELAAVDRERKLRKKEEREFILTEEARLEAEAAEEREGYIIREDLATRGFLEFPSATERALTGQKELFYGTQILEDFPELAEGISPVLTQAAAGSGFGEEVKKVGLGIGAVILGLAALIGLSKIPKSRRR